MVDRTSYLTFAACPITLLDNQSYNLFYHDDYRLHLTFLTLRAYRRDARRNDLERYVIVCSIIHLKGAEISLDLEELNDR
jgi:hypothetical protein